jgi:hypothetical protein
VSGACSDAIFSDDFEDGNSTGWTNTSAIYTTITTTVTSPGANGTADGFHLAATATFVSSTVGTTHTIPASAPTYVSFWGEVPTATTIAYLEVGTVFTVGFGSAGKFTGAGSTPGSYAANTWYHFELKNIDWVSGTYSVYVNGTLQGSGTFTVPSPATVSTIKLMVTPPTAVTSATASATFDEIVVQ